MSSVGDRGERPALTGRDGVPLHYQLSSVLRAAIRSGRYGPGDHLPGEHELSRSFGVSRATVRRALETLELEKLIDRRPGKGTEVLPRPAPIVARMDAHLRSIERDAQRTRVDVLDIADVWASHNVARGLAIDERTIVRQITRVRYRGRVPLRYMVTSVPLPLFASLTRADLIEMTVIEALRRANRPMHHAVDDIGATLADAAVADALGVPVGAPMLEMTRTMYAGDGLPIALQWTVASPDVMKLRIELTGDDEPT